MAGNPLTDSGGGLSTAPYAGIMAANAAPATNPLTTASQIQSLQNQGLQNQLLQGQVQQQQPAIDNAKLQNARNHMDFMSSVLTPLIAKGDAVSIGDVSSAASSAIARSNGMLTANDVAPVLMGMAGKSGPAGWHDNPDDHAGRP